MVTEGDKMDNEQASFSIEKIFKVFLDKWIIFAVLLVMSVIACTVYIFGIAEEYYTASTTVYVTEEVTPEMNENANLTINEERAKDYKIIATSNRVLDKVRSKYPGMTINPKRISVYEHPETRILEISVKDENAYNAATIVNEITRVMIDEVQDIISKNNIKVIDFAETPSRPEKVNPVVYYMLSVIASLFVSIVLMMLIDAFDNKVKGPEDCKERFDIPILGVIPKYLEDIVPENESKE